MNVLIAQSNVAEIIVAGDFYCKMDSRFLNSIFLDFDSGNKFVCCDMSRLSNPFTFGNSDLSRVSWIDHVGLVCTQVLDDCVIDVAVLYDFLLSDHKPLSVTFSNLLAPATLLSSLSFYSMPVVYKHCWHEVNDSVISDYSNSNYNQLIVLVICLSSGHSTSTQK